MSRYSKIQGQGVVGSSGCGCGAPASYGTAQPAAGQTGGGGFVRPRFFAGQLLTEEDLEALTSYVVAKNRLHNSHLFGQGVVCGLEVTEHPCGGGKVIVKPGYALDCCGNDIVLSCPAEVDINALVRDLRIRMTGYDCGDPCPEKDKEPCTRKDKQGAADAGDAAAGGGAAAAKAASTNGKPAIKEEAAKTAPKPAPNGKVPAAKEDTAPAEAAQPSEGRTYYLYVRYREEGTEPVAPYPTEDTCGVQQCVPTRVREGLQFELSCGEERDCTDDLCARLCRCLGDPATIIAAGKQILDNLEQTKPLHDYVLNQEKGGKADSLLILEIAKEYRARLEAPPKIRVPEIRRGVAVLRAIQSKPTAEKMVRDGVIDKKTLDELTTAIEATQKAVLKDQASGIQVNDDDERKDFELLLPQITQESGLGVADVASCIQLAVGPLALKRTFQLIQDLASATANLRLRRPSRAFVRTEWKDLRAAALATDLSAPQTPEAAQTLVKDSVQEIREFLLEILECLCEAFLPPCPQPKDLAVLLARLRVEECDVLEICNAVRKVVLSPLALGYLESSHRYWRKTLETFCCGILRNQDLTAPVDLKKSVATLQPRAGGAQIAIDGNAVAEAPDGKWGGQPGPWSGGCHKTAECSEALAYLLVVACKALGEDAARLLYDLLGRACPELQPTLAELKAIEDKHGGGQEPKVPTPPKGKSR